MIILKKTYTDLEDRYKELEKDHLNIISIKDELEMEMIKYKNLSHKSKKEVQSLEYLIKKDIKENDIKLSEYRSLLTDKKIEIDNLEKLLENYSKIIFEKDVEIKNHELLNEELKKNSELKIKETIGNKQNEIETLMKLLKKNSIENKLKQKELLEQLRKFEDNENSLIERVEEKNKEVINLKEFLAEEKKKLEQLKKKFLKDENTIATLEKELVIEKNRKIDLEKELNRFTDSLEKVQRKYSDLKSNYEMKSKELLKEKEDKKSFNKLIESYEIKIESLNKEKEEIEESSTKTLKLSNKSIDSLEKEQRKYSNLKLSYEMKEKELLKVKEENNIFSKLLEDYEIKIKSLNREKEENCDEKNELLRLLEKSDLEILNLEDQFVKESSNNKELCFLIENYELKIKELLADKEKREKDSENILKLLDKINELEEKQKKDNLNLESLKNELKLQKKENEKQKKDISCYKIDLSEQIRKAKEFERELNELKDEKEKEPEKQEEKAIETIKDITIEIESKLEEEIKVSNWDSIDLYLEYKSDAFELLKDFTYEDFKELYKEANFKKLVKTMEKKSFNDILTRINLKMPLSRGILQTVEGVYLKLMKNKYDEKERDELIKEKSKLIPQQIEQSTYQEFVKLYQQYLLKGDLNLEDKKLLNEILGRKKINNNLDSTTLEKLEKLSFKLSDIEKIESIDKNIDKNEINIQENDTEIDDFYKYASKDWFELSKICKDFENISGWLKRFIYSLGIAKETKGILTEKQVLVIESNYLDLKPALEILKNKKEKTIEDVVENKIVEKIEIEDFTMSEEIENILF